MDKDYFEKKFWFFYMDIEEEFLDISKIIPIDSVNSETFSFKYMKLLMVICSEINLILTNFMDFKEFEYEKKNIIWYEKFISTFFPNFKSSSVTCYKSYHNYNEIITPFLDWDNNNSPLWWSINNKVKHNRDELDEEKGIEKFKSANQLIVLNALAGLFILEMYFYNEIVKDNPDVSLKVPLPQSEIFHLNNWGEYYRKIIANKHFLESKNGNLVMHSSDR